MFLVISIILFFAVASPLYGNIKQLKTDVSVYKLALDNSTELQNTRDSLIEKYKSVKIEDRDRLAHFLPSTIGNIELILEIEKIASLHGMPIKNISFEAKNLEPATASTNNVIVVDKSSTENLPYGVFPMEFIIDGSYSSFVSFLGDLEHNLRLVDIKSISFAVPTATTGSATSTTNPNVYSYTLKVETYWLK